MLSRRRSRSLIVFRLSCIHESEQALNSETAITLFILVAQIIKSLISIHCLPRGNRNNVETKLAISIEREENERVLDGAINVRTKLYGVS